ncbi:hypothetical protein SAMN05444920_13821 [Nonomuraea solani]|uniref:Uncharacterized protein n=1 Tax=Nonomuraea solani TaxID=1144553 RepID=A0A1H6F034_9ACTN|nr:hypothetical protein [Nonomuraea solani]SEH03518.1 hypothetical protein SAMN05444920_13821 [Nonomuraea solani]
MAIDKITVTPESVEVDDTAKQVAFVVEGTGLVNLHAELISPDDDQPPQSLAFQPDGAPDRWKAVRPFSFADTTGVWLLLVQADGTEGDQEFEVLWSRARYPVRITGFKATTTTTIQRGDPVTLEGEVQFQEGGQWKPFGHQTVSIFCDETGGTEEFELDRVVADGKGRFEAEVYPDFGGDLRATLRITRRPGPNAPNVIHVQVAVVSGSGNTFTDYDVDKAAGNLYRHRIFVTTAAGPAKGKIQVRASSSEPKPGPKVRGNLGRIRAGTKWRTSASPGQTAGSYDFKALANGRWWRIKYLGKRNGYGPWCESP